jgi:hypothetical protein
MGEAAKKNPETAAVLNGLIGSKAKRLGVASIAEYVRELHRRQQDGKR